MEARFGVNPQKASKKKKKLKPFQGEKVLQPLRPHVKNRGGGLKKRTVND